jgi:ATP-binding protein involved in chromosome partitioning
MLRAPLRRLAESAAPAGARAALPNVARVILAASCKGGVGKSTVALNTAVALARAGARVGLLDADVFGPSVPTMSATAGAALASDARANFRPVERHGVALVSLGHACEPAGALLWRGPIAAQAVADLARKAVWPPLDFLVVDTPPGTGDVHMALAQRFALDGAIIVTTPQKVATADVERTLEGFAQLKVPVIGIVQNFGAFVCGGCGAATQIFPGNGGELLARKYSIPLLGSLPVDPEVAQLADSGVPVVVQKPQSAVAKAFASIADTVISLYPRKTE